MLEFIEIIRNKLILVVILSRRLALVVYGAVEGFHGPVVVCGPSSSGAWPWSRRSHRGWIPAETPTLPLVPVSYSTDTTIMSTLTLTTINITSRYSLALTNKCVVKVKIMKVSVLANSYLN